MKHFGKKACKWICLLILLAVLLPPGMELNAQAPYQTWTQGPNGWLVHTQDAYEPGKLLNPGLKSPEDLFVYDERLYVADTGNARILVNGEILAADSIDEDQSQEEVRDHGSA